MIGSENVIDQGDFPIFNNILIQEFQYSLKSRLIEVDESENIVHSTHLKHESYSHLIDEND
jgi:hypothetical protein